jgi:hypothetical protein
MRGLYVRDVVYPGRVGAEYKVVFDVRDIRSVLLQ